MQVREIMTCDVHVVSPNQEIRTVAQTMDKFDIGCLPVGENDRLIGMITDRDIAIRGVAAGLTPDALVREVMTPELEYCYEDDNVEGLAEQMSLAQLRRLPVINHDKRLVGIIALADLARDSRQPATEALSGISQPNGH